MPDKRVPDLINLLQATCDILEKARVIDNDKDIISFDGSRIIGVDKVNPRCEITIYILVKCLDDMIQAVEKIEKP